MEKIYSGGTGEMIRGHATLPTPSESLPQVGDELTLFGVQGTRPLSLLNDFVRVVPGQGIPSNAIRHVAIRD
jgi:hypothetical protein